ncbi:pilus assembly protein PilM [Patescibacteria group bacterium]
MFFYPKNFAFGLDIGDKSIKLADVKLKKNLKGEKRLTLTALHECNLPPGIIYKGEIKNPPAVAEAIRECTKNVSGALLSTRAVVASVPESRCYFKIIRAPQKTKQNINDFIAKNIGQHFPLEKNKLYFDWQFIDAERVAIAAAPKNLIDSYTAVIEQADLIPLSMELESMAIVRALATRVDTKSQSHKIFIDLGAGHSTIIVTENNFPILNLNIALSGENLTRQIARTQKLSYEEAEKLKLACGFDLNKCPPKTKKIINLLISSSVKQIYTSLQYINKFLKHKPDKIYICGGASQMTKLSTILSEKLRVKVRHANPLTNLTLDKEVKLTNTKLLQYVTVLGLAIKGTTGDIFKLNSH